MSDTRRYNLRSRSKRINYSDDRRDEDVVDNEAKSARVTSLTPKVKGNTKKNPRKDGAKKVMQSSKSAKVKRHGQEHTKTLENSARMLNSDESSSENYLNDAGAFSNIHQEKDSYGRLKIHNGPNKSLPSRFTSHQGMRERLPGLSASDPIHQYESRSNESNDNDVNEKLYSEEEPDSTMGDDQSFHVKFGMISPIKHDVSYQSGNHGNRFETRDGMVRNGSREPRSVLTRQASKDDIMKAFRKTVYHDTIWAIVALIIISIVAVGVILIFEDPKSISTSSTRLTRFGNQMEKLKVQFRNQNARLWKVVGGAAYNHIKDPSTIEHPIVLLLTGTMESSTTLSCLATRLAAMFDDIFQSAGLPVVIKGNTYLGKDSDKAKMDIDDKLKSAFDSGSRSAIVHNIDNLPPCSILLFHSYCENENAPYKDIAIIQTVQLPIDDVDLHDLRPKELDTQVRIHLKMIWDQCPSEMPIDKQDAILSRIANNVVMVKAEETIDILKACS